MERGAETVFLDGTWHEQKDELAPLLRDGIRPSAGAPLRHKALG